MSSLHGGGAEQKTQATAYIRDDEGRYLMINLGSFEVS